jgi:hypothetical protein
MRHAYGDTTGDLSADIILGLVPGVSRVAVLGIRTIATAISTPAAEAHIWGGAAATYPLPTAAVALEAVSDSASDTAAGVGMQALAFGGLDANYATVAATVQMNGLTPVALPTAFRINSAVNVNVTPTTGTQRNVGTITIRDAGGGTVRAIILPDAGTLQQAIYTVPAGFNFLMHSFEGQILSSGGASARGADFALIFRRPQGNAIKPRRLGCTDVQPAVIDAKTRILVPEKNDFIVSCVYTSNNAMSVGASFEGHLYRA